MENIGKIFIVSGIILLSVGLLFQFTSFGKMPGDIFIKKGNFIFSFPIVTSIIISIILTIVLNILFKK